MKSGVGSDVDGGVDTLGVSGLLTVERGVGLEVLAAGVGLVDRTTAGVGLVDRKTAGVGLSVTKTTGVEDGWS